MGKQSGYGLTQAFTSGQDVAYAAATTVAKASLARTNRANEWTRRWGPTCEIVFPIVLIDGRLFECYLDQESQVGLSEITSGILLWRNPMVRMPHTIIRILTVAGFADFVSDASDTAEFLLTSCDSELVEVAKKYKEKQHKKHGQTKRQR